MATYMVKLKKREEVAEGTMAFYLEKPKGFGFTAGQFITVTLIDPPETDAEGDTRAFSVASAPYEEDVMIATRMRDTAFKRVLKTMAIGAAVKVKGPFGSLTLHDDAARPAVFLAGGIGITPFRSILLQATHHKLAHDLFLFYSNRRPEDAAFLEELKGLERDSHHYMCIGTMADMEQSHRPWQGETGYIDKTMLAKFVADWTRPIYYSAGPPAMVTAMRRMLTDAGVTDEAIRTEEFAGY